MSNSAQKNDAAIDTSTVHLITDSVYFDKDFYLKQAADPKAAENPALHYLTVGERLGIPASAVFDPSVYHSLNPDVRASGMSALVHYELFGRHEGRAITFACDRIRLNLSKIDPGKPTVVLILHEATYSGAPILGWNIMRELKLTRNVVVLLRKGGPLTKSLDTFASAVIECPGPEVTDNPHECKRLAERIKAAYDPIYVIANSVETRMFGVALRQTEIPLISLVHEFASHSAPYALTAFFKSSDLIVFPSKLVHRSNSDAYGIIEQRHYILQPQGPSEVPRLLDGEVIEAGNSMSGASDKALEKLLAAKDAPFTVVGLGAVDLRKGVDLFIATATALNARYPDIDFRFIWIGERVLPKPNQYYTFLDEQIERCGIKDRIHMYSPVDDLEPVYAAADALFVSSRLDPLPNVGIDAMLRGVPVLCFEEATGFAEILSAHEDTRGLVAAYMDTGAIAEELASLAQDASRKQKISRTVSRIARANFNMMTYVKKLDTFGRHAAARLKGIDDQVETLVTEKSFNAELYLGAKATASLTLAQAARRYLLDTSNVNFCGPAVWGDHPRRALEGFHALRYGELAPDFPRDGTVDPLVHFARSGRPIGPWIHKVIHLPGDRSERELVVTRKPVAMHGHFHYLDNFPEFLEAMDANKQPVDLFLTTTASEAAHRLEKMTEAYTKGRVQISVLNNLGRDVRPFVKLLEGALDGYDIIGHVHGKRSVHTMDYDSDLGNRWRVFLWQHLMGPDAPAADIIIEEMEKDPSIGMVFPQNDFLVGWELNKEIAADMAPRLGIKQIPEHLEFPVGTMFWARRDALQKLVEAQFTEEDYPQEPLPIDGTMLHALERLLPVIVEESGYKLASTYFPKYTR
ncbi:rhamnan synthesis F family protein [Asticcacaulis sp.]|uniref:rhamnan synthesis F family protein n=1 Tax=Asticcacaulis sp. TaxID=1872648 RepID=UPI00260EF70C|nr:rhamnan synthesis F family protein [Asticcacaulis sp.]